jgi:hypothetical protein
MLRLKKMSIPLQEKNRMFQMNYRVPEAIKSVVSVFLKRIHFQAADLL